MKAMSKQARIIIIIGVVLVLLLAGLAAVAYAPAADEQQSPTSNGQQAENPNDEPRPSTTPYRGELVCLPPKDATGPQTLECAVGLKDKDGMFYGLQAGHEDLDYYTLPTGTIVEVQAELLTVTDDKYDTTGVLKVYSYDTIE
jgi:hypothetical protein